MRTIKDETVQTICSIFLIIAGIFTVLIIIGVVSIGFSGFGVDSHGRVYIGIGHKIEVIEDGIKVLTIKKCTERGYAFKVLEDDTILLATCGEVVKMDLEGKSIIEKWDDTYTKIFNKINDAKRNPISRNESTYTVRYPFGRLTIKKDNTIVYQIPLLDYFAGILFPVSIVGAILCKIYIKKLEYF